MCGGGGGGRRGGGRISKFGFDVPLSLAGELPNQQKEKPEEGWFRGGKTRKQ